MLYVSSQSNSNALNLALYPVLRAWSAGYATWVTTNGSSARSAAGCDGAGVDRSGSAVATVTRSTAGVSITLIGLASVVQEWVVNPSSNFGLLRRLERSAGVAQYNLASAQNATMAAYWPPLTVTHTSRAAGTRRRAGGRKLAAADSATITKYYTLGGQQRVVMRRDGTLYYLFSDHLGSTNLVTTASGAEVARQLYKPFGEPRWTSGTLPTDRRFTGQRSEEATLGSLHDYNARFYSPRWAVFSRRTPSCRVRATRRA